MNEEVLPHSNRLSRQPTRHMPILYLPDTLLDSRRQRAKGALWGWRTRDLTFVVGAIFGKDDEFATRSISKLNEAHGTDLRILGRLDDGGGTENPGDVDSGFIRVSFRKGSPPEILSERDPDWNPSVVVYAPLGRLEALSLQPMPLDLLRGDHQSPGSAGSSRRRHVYLTTKQDIQPEVLSTAKRAVEWVRTRVQRGFGSDAERIFFAGQSELTSHSFPATRRNSSTGDSQSRSTRCTFAFRVLGILRQHCHPDLPTASCRSDPRLFSRR